MEYTIHTTEIVRVVTTVAPLICSTVNLGWWPTAGGVIAAIGVSRGGASWWSLWGAQAADNACCRFVGMLRIQPAEDEQVS